MELAIGLSLRALVLLLLPAILDAARREMGRGRYWF